jgi:hypothetical protein
MKRTIILAISAVLTLNFILCLPVQAQMDPDPSEDLSGTPDPGNDVPVDGGLSLLLAAGAAYGAGRLRRKARESKD